MIKKKSVSFNICFYVSTVNKASNLILSRVESLISFIKIQRTAQGTREHCELFLLCPLLRYFDRRTSVKITSRSDIHNEKELVTGYSVRLVHRKLNNCVQTARLCDIAWDGQKTGRKGACRTSTNCPGGTKKIYETARCH